MNDYTGADLMAAILDLRDATAAGFARADARLEHEVGSLRSDMNRRFDRVDERFDRVDERFDRMDEDRVGRAPGIEPNGQRPAS